MHLREAGVSFTSQKKSFGDLLLPEVAMHIRRHRSSVLLAIAGALALSWLTLTNADSAADLLDQIVMAIEPSLKPGLLF